jgi:hypothetical protein
MGIVWELGGNERILMGWVIDWNKRNLMRIFGNLMGTRGI